MPSKKGAGTKPVAQNKKNAQIAAEGSHIVFEDDKKQSKKASKSKETPAAEASGPPKPTVKQIIGGASWTGKLPVNLLSEHCQRQKWNKPEYSMRQSPGRDGHEKLYRSEVTLSKKDPKTNEITTLPTFRTPQILLSASEEPSALEARHFAATYALFRVSNMKNLSMALPPKYRDLWKELSSVKKEDEKEGKAWLYDADPFAAEQKRHEIHRAMEKRKAEQEKKQEALAKNPTLALQQVPRSKDWERAPKIEMGSKIRTEVETLIRDRGVWNPYRIQLTKQEHERIVQVLHSRGFRKSHIEEASQYCKDEDETLEWLMIHVPEDDLPPFALPANYSAGISLASGDIVQEAKLKRLVSAGYSRDLVTSALRECDGQEQNAAFWLQKTIQTSADGDLNDDIDSSIEWESEETTLEAIYGDRYEKKASHECSITLDTDQNLHTVVRFIISKQGYPWDLPAILISSDKIPAYIKLSATKQALEFAETNFKGVPMIFSICEWLEGNLQSIVDNPSSLMELHQAAKPPSEKVASQGSHIVAAFPDRTREQRIDRRNDKEILNAWTKRQELLQQQQMMKAREALPAWQKQKDILRAISRHRTTIITGETGSGKSTQVVQFVLDQAIQELKGSSTSIMCTQPRRVAALSLADRVSSERCTEVGNEVGYIIRGESRTSNSTKITFMTTGVLLRRLQTSASVKDALVGISHVFIDEVHERSLDTDFLMALLKESLSSHPNLSIVLMSATVDKDIFMDYFGGPKQVAHIHIEGRTFPVTDYYLEEVLQTINFIPSSDDGQEMPIGKAIQALGTGINYDLIRKLIQNIDNDLYDAAGGILIFLPGTLEIDRCIRALAELPNLVVYPLHASLSPSEQKKVFPAVARGKRKVIAATNVAETSITIQDIVAVVDTGRVKETRYDISNNVVRLEEIWASQAACQQRRGRAGRVRAGKCYKLFTTKIEAQMAPKPLPEIQRVPLEQLCLSVKATSKNENVSEFLNSLITPPEQGAITHALNFLHLIGALENDLLTALGTYLSMIPADLRCAKLLVYGILFDCLEPCLTVASILTVKDPFVSPREKREEADAAKLSFSTKHGDLIMRLSAYEEYARLAQDSRFHQIRSWCSEKFLSLNVLREITSTRSQLLESLKTSNLVDLDYEISTVPVKDYSRLLLQALISAALQPQIAEIRFPEKKYMQSLTGAKELDAEAKTIKYFIAPHPIPEGGDHNLTTSSLSTTPQSSRASTPPPSVVPSQTVLVDRSENSWQRVFVHPSSPLFHSTPTSFTSGSASASYLSYFNKISTGGNTALFGHKTYIHSLTPLNTYTQLLFGSEGVRIDSNIPGGGLIISNHYKVRGWVRIGVLVSRLRRILDEELKKAIDMPANRREFGKNEVVRIIKRLIELNGQDR